MLSFSKCVLVSEMTIHEFSRQEHVSYQVRLLKHIVSCHKNGYENVSPICSCKSCSNSHWTLRRHVDSFDFLPDPPCSTSPRPCPLICPCWSLDGLETCADRNLTPTWPSKDPKMIRLLSMMVVPCAARFLRGRDLIMQIEEVRATYSPSQSRRHLFASLSSPQ